MSGSVIDVDRTSFDREVLERSRRTLVVVDFWASWCAPCQALGPILESEVAKTAGRAVLAKVDVDRAPDLANEYGVSGIPHVVAFREARPVAQFTGAQPSHVVASWLRQLLPPPGDEAVRAARDAVAKGELDEALALLEEATEAEPAPARAVLERARVHVARGEFELARAQLERIPPGVPEAQEADQERALLEMIGAGGEGDRLTEADLDGADLDALFADAGRAWRAGDAEAAVDRLLRVMRRDRSYRDGLAHRALLAIFEHLGPDHELTRAGRQWLGMILFA